ncbi:toll/interleukin-1 receptor domain-containing protein [Variovorax sp. J22R133]|uniref:toll/interleukin-1 receptor domain-containing protein n=1 Tax=Variovorax brevis TaxID=3053503 RepID=UPI0025780C42|nr:toll/interleukin-1 receptor domain-containing protein [Variovorax sp. J22R133]MDM0117991.1 toll/interleukin-1 receptor domain-containing protein [Variovorax sp. J22R133]
MRTNSFLSHSHDDAVWVEDLARRLEDELGLAVWLDRWVLVPGQSWQQAMARGLEEANSCAVFIGANTPHGWFNEEIQRALDLQVRNPDFRVIPVLLPDADPASIPGFLSMRTWADFRDGQDQAFALHVLRQGILGEPVGRWPPEANRGANGKLRQYEQQIGQLARFRSLGVHEEVIIEFERKILDQWLDEGGAL